MNWQFLSSQAQRDHTWFLATRLGEHGRPAGRLNNSSLSLSLMSPPTLHSHHSPHRPFLSSPLMAHPPSRRPLTAIEASGNRIHERRIAGFANSGVDLRTVLRAPSPICTRPPRPTNAVPATPAPPPYPDLMVMGSMAAPEGAATVPLLETTLGGRGLPPSEGFLRPARQGHG